MSTFESELKNKIDESKLNNYSFENYEANRYGPLKLPKNNFYSSIKKRIKRIINQNKNISSDDYIKALEYKNELQWLWNILDNEEKKVLIELIAYRILGYKKVMLSRNNIEYSNAIKLAEELANKEDNYNLLFKGWTLQKMDLTKIGKNIQFYFSPFGVAIDFIIEQYAFKKNNQNIIEAMNGETVLDLGGCWGDTALYFAEKVGINGKVYSFEFIPNNIKIHNLNTSLNPHLKSQIELIEHPASNTSDEIIYYKDNGPGSRVETTPFDDYTGTSTTISIDDFVKNKNIKKVDFIKMDIEGSEPFALKGAINTIKNHKPKLAIAIYHNMSDFVNIPKWIHDLNLGYQLHLGHYTIYNEETIIFAEVK